MVKRRLNKAFTLVEILIVVVILGILAAIVVPQFSRASEDAQVSNVESQLQTLRSQVELFRVRNNGEIPGSGGPASNGDVFNTLTNPPAGQEPYLRNAPVNPRTGTSTIIEGTEPASAAAAIGDPGWIYDAATGRIWANGFNENHRQPGAEFDAWFRAR
jgi:general secretion pathway protein G